MMKDWSEVEVEVVFQGDRLVPEALTTALGRAPTTHFAKGDAVGDGHASAGLWRAKLPSVSLHLLETAITAFFENTDPVGIRELALANHGRIICRPNGPNVGVCFSHSICEQAARFGLSLWVIKYAERA